MSQQKRKIGYWSIEFQRGDLIFFDGELFSQFINYIGALPTQKQLQTNTRTSKSIAIDKIWKTSLQSHIAYEIVFKSCKFNHSPDYMSSTDGSERPTEKLLHEGDKEVTHFCIRVDKDEAFCVAEERRSGVTFNAAIQYFNGFLRQFLLSISRDDGTVLVGNIVPSENFLDALDHTSKISVAELFVDNEVLGSGYLDLLDVDASVREDVVMTVKSVPKQSLPKKKLKELYMAITTSGTKVRRIRVRAKDINNMSVLLDTLSLKKKDEIVVDLLPNGIVNSSTIFQKMEEAIEE